MKRRHTALLASMLLVASAASAESTRTLRTPYGGDPARPFVIENLAGAMRVGPGTSDEVVVNATVHAEDDALAAAIRIEPVTDEKGRPGLRVRYPLETHSTLRYPGGSRGGRQGGDFGNWLGDLFGGGGGSSHAKYDGHRVRVAADRGALLYVDLDIALPRRSLEAVFKNRVGPIDGQGVEGRLTFDTGSGDVRIGRLKGDITADTGSGNVKADGIDGNFTCDTGSGDCSVANVNGESVKCDTGSGQIRVSNVAARTIDVDTGSGDVEISGADAVEFKADTGSGDIEFEARGTRLERVAADTGSGDVRLRLHADAGFEARADQGSGEITSRFSGSEPILRRREVVGYRRGDGKLRIAVETGSGDVVIEPTR